MRRFLVIAVVGVLAACGSSSGGDSSAYVDAAMKSYDNSSAKDKEGFSRDQAKCLVTGMIDIIGVDNLKKAGITPSDLSKDSNSSPFSALSKDVAKQKNGEIADLMLDGRCFDFIDVLMSQSGGGSGPFGNLGKAKTRCIFTQLFRDKAVKNALAESMIGNSSSGDDALSKAFSNQSKLFTILGDCKISPSELSGS